jgi:FkbM family methyltransferase
MALGALFYPKGTKKNPIRFEELFIPHIFREIYFDGLYVDIFNQRKDMVVLDIGANIGIITDYMRPYCQKLYAIEPSSEHFEALKKNKEFNRWDNVELFNLAIADKNGKMRLNTLAANRTCYSLALNYQQGGEEVETMRIDTFLEKNKIKKVDFVKMDIEGEEEAVLRGEGFRKAMDKIDAMEIEFHLPGWQELVNYLIGLGFEARRYESSAVVVLFTKK